jgi:hypothetical protein
MSKTDMVNVKMVITEDKILSNIEKVQKMINANSKKQIVELEEDSYFKDLIESIKTYLIEYPEKDNFPKKVYDAAYNLVEYATSQFEDNTKLIEDLIRQREKNIALSVVLKDTLQLVEDKDPDWKKKVQDIANDFPAEIIDTLGSMGRAKSNKTPNYLDDLKIVNTKISNLESNLHIEIDMERIEDRSKALSYIGIEIAEALKEIPAPEEVAQEEKAVQTIEQKAEKEEKVQVAKKDEKSKEREEILDAMENEQYIEETRVNVKPSLWERIKNMKLLRTIRYVMKIKVVLELPALPEGKPEGQQN